VRLDNNLSSGKNRHHHHHHHHARHGIPHLSRLACAAAASAEFQLLHLLSVLPGVTCDV
jgi:hypothetical protein